jgi:mono/diheme cytochrome c family protein
MDVRWRSAASDSAVFYSIKNGRAQGMPNYGRLLSDSTIWQLVAYIKSQPVPGRRRHGGVAVTSSVQHRSDL